MTVFRQQSSASTEAGDLSPRFAASRGYFAAFIKFTPALWLFGALIPCAFLLLIKLGAGRWPKGRLINCVIFAWMAIAVAQACCSIFNGLIQHDLGTGLRNAISFTAIGWLFGALAISAGHAYHLNDRSTARLVSYLGGYIVLLSGIAVIGHLAGVATLRMPTPIGMLLPAGNATNFYASMTIYQSEDTLGESRTRLILFFPWATALGLGGLAIALISTRVEESRFRLIGMVGGAIGVIFSWSRIAIATMILVSAILIFVKFPRYLKLLSVSLVAILLYAISLLGIDPLALITDVHEAADQARAGSSLARDLIYEKSWEGFLRSPVIGNGWIGESVHRTENLPIGSHSTVYGLLYTGGAITFGCYVLAMAITGFALIYAIYYWRKERVPRQNAIIGLCLWLSLLLYSPYESLFSLTLPCLYLFTWIGASIPGGHHDKVRAGFVASRKVFAFQQAPHHPGKMSTALAYGATRGSRRQSAFRSDGNRRGEGNGRFWRE